MTLRTATTSFSKVSGIRWGDRFGRRDQDLDIGDDGGITYRTRLSVSFKFEDS